MRNIIFLTFFGLVITILTISCRKEVFYEGDMPRILLSTDTITYDTIFTTRGSTTKLFKVINKEEEILKVDISLGKKTDFFRMNVDGIPTDYAKDVEILPQDSIYVFVEVTIDPSLPLEISPFIIEDYILVQSKKTTDTLNLEAWGQNANYIPGPNRNSLISILSCDLGTIRWDDPKPYVLNGLLIIDSCTLDIPPGTEIYVHGGYAVNDLGIYQDGLILVQNKGRIISTGTLEEPVVFQGDRLESFYDEVPGQWNGIRFVGQSRGSEMKHTTIKNAGISLYVDSLSELTLDQCSVINSGSYALLTKQADVNATNCVFGISGQPSVSLSLGGNYNFEYCTIANEGGRSNQAMFFSNFTRYGDPLNPLFIVNPLNLTIKNSIISSQTEEAMIIAQLEGTDETTMNYKLDHVAFNYTGLYEDVVSLEANCVQCTRIDRTQKLFIDSDVIDFHLDSLSQVDSLAMPSDIKVDRDDVIRDNQFPDLGAYESTF